jgi:hypothetical protein
MFRMTRVLAGVIVGLSSAPFLSLAEPLTEATPPAATLESSRAGEDAAALPPSGASASTPDASYLDNEFEQPDMAELERWWQRYQRSLRLQLASPSTRDDTH